MSAVSPLANAVTTGGTSTYPGDLFTKHEKESAQVAERLSKDPAIQTNPEMITAFEKAISESNTHVLELILEHHLIAKERLESELKSFSKDVKAHRAIIKILLKWNIPFDDEVAAKIVESGLYFLFKLAQDHGANVSKHVFQTLPKTDGDKVVKDLLRGDEAGQLDPDLTYEGQTLLFASVSLGLVVLAQELMSYGANSAIRARDGRTVFDVSKEKSPALQELLYHPERLSRSVRSKGITIPPTANEEEALRSFLHQACAGKPSAHYFALFIKTDQVALAILKSGSFFRNFDQVSGFGMLRKDRIYCWSPQATYPIPESYVPNETSLGTLGMAIKRVGDHFVCQRLPNEYQTPNPSTDQGFKYSCETIGTHGHRKNPNAALAAFRREQEAILQATPLTIAPLPEFDRHIRELQQMHQLLHGLQQLPLTIQGEQSALLGNLQTLLESAEARIQWRYGQETVGPREHLAIVSRVDQGLRDLQKQVSAIRTWQETVAKHRRQVEELEEALKALAKALDLDRREFHLQEISKAVKNISGIINSEPVTSAVQPTLKIYHAELAVQNIFHGTEQTIKTLQVAICHVIGKFLGIVTTREPLHQQNFSQKDFRKRALQQFEHELEFIIHTGDIDDPLNMQRVAAEIAILRDLLNIIDTMPPLSLGVQYHHAGFTQESAINDCIERFRNVQKTLNFFWKTVVLSQEASSTHLDKVLQLLLQRLLLMDEAECNRDHEPWAYPSIKDGDVKDTLYKQLFLLITSFFIAQSQSGTTQAADTLQPALSFTQLLLRHSVYGPEKKRHKFSGFFMTHLIDVLNSIKGIVQNAWEVGKPSLLEPLHNLVDEAKWPDKKSVEEALIKYFLHLVINAPLPRLGDTILELARTAEEVAEKISRLPIAQVDGNLAQLESSLVSGLTAIKLIPIDPDTSADFDRFTQQLLEGSITTIDDESRKKLRAGQASKLISEMIALMERMIASFKKLDASRIKQLQKDCLSLERSIEQYLSSIAAEKPLAQDFKQACHELLANFDDPTITTKVKEVQFALQAISEGKPDSTVAQSMKQASQQILVYLNGREGRKLGGQWDAFAHQLKSQVDSWLRSLTPGLLQDLPLKLRQYREHLLSEQISDLKKKASNLKLGIRAQTFIRRDKSTTLNYLWDGAPFDTDPAHTEELVHIPIENA